MMGQHCGPGVPRHACDVTQNHSCYLGLCARLSAHKFAVLTHFILTVALSGSTVLSSAFSDGCSKRLRNVPRWRVMNLDILVQSPCWVLACCLALKLAVAFPSGWQSDWLWPCPLVFIT